MLSAKLTYKSAKKLSGKILYAEVFSDEDREYFALVNDDMTDETGLEEE